MRKKNTFADRFLDRLDVLGLTQGQVAEKLGTSKSLVSNWSNNKTIPALRNSKKLSKLLKVSVEYLLTGEEEADITGSKFDNYDKHSIGERPMLNTSQQLGYIMEHGAEADIELIIGKIGRIYNETQLKKHIPNSKK